MDTPSLIATIVGSILASSGLWAVVQTVINKKTGRDKDMKDIKDQLAELKKDNIASHKYQEAMISAQRDLMRERLLDAYYRCTNKGYFSREERETYEALFEQYQSEPFNGNGVIHDLWEIMRELPWDKESR